MFYKFIFHSSFFYYVQIAFALRNTVLFQLQLTTDSLSRESFTGFKILFRFCNVLEKICSIVDQC